VGPGATVGTLQTRYPAYKLESKIRKTYYHMPYNVGSCLPAREGSGATTCPTTLDSVSLFGRAPALPRVPRLWILPPCSGGLWRCHVSYGTEPCLPAQEGFGAATCPVALCGPQTSRIKKCLDGLPMRLDSCVSKACLYVTEMPDT
jgi:hypothetical protein